LAAGLSPPQTPPAGFKECGSRVREVKKRASEREREIERERNGEREGECGRGREGRKE